MQQADTAAHGRQAAHHFAKLAALSHQGPALFLLQAGHPDQRKGFVVSSHVTAVLEAQATGIVAIVVDLTALRVQRLWDYYNVVDAFLNQLSVQPKAGGARLVAAVDLFGLVLLFLGKLYEPLWQERLDWLLRQVAYLPSDFELVSVYVQAQLDTANFLGWFRVRLGTALGGLFCIHILCRWVASSWRAHQHNMPSLLPPREERENCVSVNEQRAMSNEQ